jgi:hypothetical protein
MNSSKNTDKCEYTKYALSLPAQQAERGWNPAHYKQASLKLRKRTHRVTLWCVRSRLIRPVPKKFRFRHKILCFAFHSNVCFFVTFFAPINIYLVSLEMRADVCRSSCPVSATVRFQSKFDCSRIPPIKEPHENPFSRARVVALGKQADIDRLTVRRIGSFLHSLVAIK